MPPRVLASNPDVGAVVSGRAFEPFASDDKRHYQQNVACPRLSVHIVSIANPWPFNSRAMCAIFAICTQIAKRPALTQRGNALTRFAGAGGIG